MIALTLSAALLASRIAVAQDQDHEKEPERGRMLLVFAPNEESKQLVAEYDELQRDLGALGNEDVDVVYVIGDHMVKLPPPDAKTESAENLRKHYHIDATGFRVVLVGKDGWEKARWNEPVTTDKILSRAPDMPRPKSALDTQK
jgi:hypothetical protein